MSIAARCIARADRKRSGRSVEDALTVSAPGSRTVLVGMQRPTVEIAAYAVSVEERTIVGSYSYTDAEFADTAAWVGTAPAELPRLIEGRVGWESAAETFTGLAKGSYTVTPTHTGFTFSPTSLAETITTANAPPIAGIHLPAAAASRLEVFE